ncbi:hypothetical protein M595_3524 [Lyngbya aestuarii BL J]|uniref:Uncharacterized protein n=1 Tax=Lyngbya aestuarii BL J TaxID=1348334 RepID=U7QGZ7_9CYAN|nr:hypothetical protein M595_3524 [Lyngbya aestuarii BL J]
MWAESISDRPFVVRALIEWGVMLGSNQSLCSSRISAI